jgi:hypothetical protein
MRTFFLSIFLLFVPVAEAANPNGATGDLSKWQPAWTKDFNDCFEKEGQHLKQKSPTDAGQYCGSVSSNDSKYWLSIFIPLAQKESNFDPSAHGQNGGKVPIGLFQMDSTDMKSHKCDGADPANPQQSICCAVKIADDEAQKFNQISQKGSAGIMSAFWQPMKDGMGGNGKGSTNVNNSSNHTAIKNESKSLCQSNFASVGGDNNGSSGGSSQGSAYSSPANVWKWSPAVYATRQPGSLR